jgi:DNA-binding response OmpR family regulator
MSSVTVSPCRVLVAVDEKRVQSALMSLIKAQGFQALEADDGRSAMKIIRQGDVDAIKVDSARAGSTISLSCPPRRETRQRKSNDGTTKINPGQTAH